MPKVKKPSDKVKKIVSKVKKPAISKVKKTTKPKSKIGYELIIAEKPSAAKKIAEALSTSKMLINKDKGVTNYIISHNGKDIVVANAVGHLYGLKQLEGTKKDYPNYSIDWAPSSEVGKNSDYTKKYLARLKKLAKGANIFTVATDYDVEGEVIGLNVIKYACKQKDANRMKFSTTTKAALITAYENKSSTLDWGQAFAGETRHKLDWYYGINISRALTQAMTKKGRYKTMSTGRVQGPALKIVVDKEKTIKAFKSDPFWELRIEILKCSTNTTDLLAQAKTRNKLKFLALHKKDKFFDKKEFDKIQSIVDGQKEAIVDKVERKQFKQAPPFPFDLTALQIEVFRCFRISPKETLSLAQDLYTNSYISYPRTSSNQLPKDIGYEKTLKLISNNPNYKQIVDILLSKKKVLMPNNGKKQDPAHPAIYPTGEIPRNLDERQAKVYDIIVKRFIATFGEPAIRETLKVTFNVKDELFLLKGTITKVKAWHEFYQPYVNLKEEDLPNFEEKEVVPISDIIAEEKETQPPKRYTEASIIKELEKRNLGTKATRASILDTLFQRGYINGKPIIATEVGLKTESILAKFCPDILDEELTRNFELEMEEIREKKKTGEQVLDGAKKVLNKILKKFDSKKDDVGEALIEAADAQREADSSYGHCPKCADGNLTMKRGKFGLFLACNKYPDCKRTLALPKGALTKYAGRQCELCNFPIVKVIRKGKRPEEICINPDCSSRKEEQDKLQEFVGNKCPNCEPGKLVLRKSAYGAFIACDQFPKCKYVMNNKFSKKKKEE
jgi:DNA topoisomerase I